MEYEIHTCIRQHTPTEHTSAYVDGANVSIRRIGHLRPPWDKVRERERAREGGGAANLGGGLFNLLAVEVGEEVALPERATEPNICTSSVSIGTFVPQ
jgi:hypothetical protein